MHVTKDKTRKRIVVLELLVILAFAVFVFLISSQYDFLEKIVEFSHKHENLEIDEIICVFIFLLFASVIVSIRRLQEQVKSQKTLLQLNQDLQKALSEIKQLQGIIPICSTCKNIRDDKGYWRQVESYILEHTGAEFSHGICPNCLQKLFPDMVEEEDEIDGGF